MTVTAESSIADYYQVRLLDTTGTQIALFDNWINLTYTKQLNGVGTYSFTIDGNDPRRSLFGTDCLFEVYRGIPGCEVDWYKDFEGFHRKPTRTLSNAGERVFTSEGVSYEDLLARTVINFKAGTIYADKAIETQTAMLQFVEENCGPTATIANGRITNGVLPNFSVATGIGYGPLWEGSRAFENLLDILVELGEFGGIDFAVISPSPSYFQFVTYPDHSGEDRSIVGLDSSTGLNAAGNPPVILSAEMGTVQDAEYALDHLKEGNVAIVLGPGEGTLRDVYPSSDAVAIADSPWNRCEVARPSGNQEFESQFYALGQDILHELSTKETFAFTPLQQPSCLYGVQYNLGTLLTVRFDEFTQNRRVTRVTVNVSAGTHTLAFEFTE